MRFTDARTGRLVEPKRSAVLRILVRASAGDPRPYLVADQVRRLLDVRGRRVAVAHDGGEPPRVLAALNVHPPAQFDGDVDVTVRGAEGSEDSAGSEDSEVEPTHEPGLVLEVGPVRLSGTAADPLALRLALLARPYAEPARIDDEVLAAADRTLTRWRNRVAKWAESPSAPVDRCCVAEVSAALEDDLDGLRALAALQRLEEDETVPPGGRFETFAFLDRLLGLDLARDVGA